MFWTSLDGSFEGDTRHDLVRPGPLDQSSSPRTQGSLVRGNIFKEDGKTPIANALVEIWHCDENEVYDNISDDYKYRGGQRTKADGKYSFKSILPVPYKANPNDDASWRPAHIHMRVSVPNQQDLITQIYFKGGKYVETDRWASAPQAVNRILNITQNSGESEIEFNVILAKEIPLDQKVYDNITGLYTIDENNTLEFTKNDDMLFMKRNGQLTASLSYTGNNTFVSGIGYPKAAFEPQADGSVKLTIERTPGKVYTGTKFLKYNQ
ncbi:MAG: hypothetical protein IPP93_12235 [Chitinophagaceae bacterium]|nr:hypothetical protein [Chitinophagaceae bacterium]